MRHMNKNEIVFDLSEEDNVNNGKEDKVEEKKEEHFKIVKAISRNVLEKRMREKTIRRKEN